MSDRVAVMSDGRLQQVGTPADLYQAPTSPFVADFIGKMNFLDGVLLGTEGATLAVRVASGAVLRLPNRLNGTAASLADEAPLRIAIRPERLRIAAAGTGDENAITGTVDAAIFAGAHKTYVVSLDRTDGAPLHIQLPADGATGFQRGEKVDVMLEHDGVNVFATVAQT